MRLRISFRTFPSVFLTSSVQWAPTSNRISLCILLFGAEEIKNINSPQNSGFGHCKLQVLPRCWGQYYLGCVVVFYFVQGTENQIMKLECLSPLAFGLFVNCTSIIWSNPSLLVSPPPAWPSSLSVCLFAFPSTGRSHSSSNSQPRFRWRDWLVVTWDMWNSRQEYLSLVVDWGQSVSSRFEERDKAIWIRIRSVSVSEYLIQLPLPRHWRVYLHWNWICNHRILRSSAVQFSSVPWSACGIIGWQWQWQRFYSDPGAGSVVSAGLDGDWG